MGNMGIGTMGPPRVKFKPTYLIRHIPTLESTKKSISPSVKYKPIYPIPVTVQL